MIEIGFSASLAHIEGVWLFTQLLEPRADNQTSRGAPIFSLLSGSTVSATLRSTHYQPFQFYKEGLKSYADGEFRLCPRTGICDVLCDVTLPC